MKKIAIIGLGPAGLAAAHSLSKSKELSIISFDKGKDLLSRHHNSADDLGIGCGGAGLFSDGKFSFYPAGLSLYEELEKSTLKHAYNEMCGGLKKFSIDFEKINIKNFKNKNEVFYKEIVEKKYFVSHADLEKRKNYIKYLSKSLKEKPNEVYYRHEIIDVKVKNNIILTAIDLDQKKKRIFEVDYIIFSTGRFGSLDTYLEKFEQQKQRFEFGIRIETSFESDFFKNKSLDIKKKWKLSEGIEARTFCTCRQGEIWQIPYGKFSAISGRSDGPRTQFSNFGILIRFTGKKWGLGKDLWDIVFSNSGWENSKVLWQPFTEFMNNQNINLPVSLRKSENGQKKNPWFPKKSFKKGNINKLLGKDLSNIFKEALRDFVSDYPDLDSPSTNIFFPCIEGVGTYPNLRKNSLMSKNLNNVFFCGDVCGYFRGLVPALLSGYYVSEEIKELIDDY